MFKRLNSFSFCFFSFVFFICPQILHAQVKPKYNVLFVAVDDMNDRISFLGNPEIPSPNLQRLVNHGMVFTQAYTQYPMCNASRTALLSGWRPDKTKVFSNAVRPRSVMGPDVLFLPEYFRQYGYRTERYGKIMHDLFEDDITWDYAEPAAGSGGGDFSKNNLAGSVADPGGEWWIINVPDSLTSDGVETSHLLTRMQQPQPPLFFYALGFHNPHNPFNPNLYYWNTIGDSTVKELLPVTESGLTTNLRGNGSSNIIIPQTPLNDRDDVPSIAFPTGPIIKTDDDWKRTIHAYDGEVKTMDAELGLILDEMDRQNLWENTVVVFWSDHGQHLGEHDGTWLKNTLFEESLHVPFIVCAPGKAPGVCNKLVELEDIYPTLAELCGLPAPQGMEGYSFVPLFDNPDMPWKRAVFSQVKRNNTLMAKSVRTDQYRYNTWGTYGEELYDLYADPHEYTNLATNPNYASVLNEMRTILAEGWMSSLPCDKLKTFYADKDGDGYGNIADSVETCAAPENYVIDNTDCDDSNASIHPGAADICDGIDNNCNGLIDENAITATVTSQGSTSICYGSSDTLLANSGLNISYQWMKDGLDIRGSKSRMYIARKAGNYQVKESNNFNCNDTSNVTAINVLSIPSATITPLGSLDICLTGSVALQANSGIALTYQWKKNENNIAGATKRIYTATSTGNYTVTVTNSSNCSKTSAVTAVAKSCFALSVNPSNIVTVKAAKLSLSPNPSKGNITVVYNSNNAGKIQFKVFDVAGKVITSKSDAAIKGVNTYHFNLSNLTAGIYYFEVNNNGVKQRIQFVIEK